MRLACWIAAALLLAPIAHAQSIGTPGSVVPKSADLGLFGMWVPLGFSTGQPSQVVVGGATTTSQACNGSNFTYFITDLNPGQFCNGWVADITFKGLTPSNGSYSSGWPDYSLGSESLQGLYFTDTSPNYTCTTSGCTAGTTTRQIYATSPLRQSYANNLNPTEASLSSNTVATVALNDFVYQADTLTNATALAAIYTGSGSVASAAASSIPVTNNSTRAYPQPICAWITEPGLRIGTSGALTVEMFCGHAYGAAGEPLAGVTFTLSDGTHTASHTAASMTQSNRQWHTTCTATTGSNVLQNCGIVAGLWTGERLTVANGSSLPSSTGNGIPGQPEIAQIDTSTTTQCVTAPCLELGQGGSIAAPALSMTPTTGGAVTISATPGNGEGLGDGAFVGAKIYNTNLGTNPATVIAPVATCSTSGASTTITLGAPGSGKGQWLVKQWITGGTIPLGDYLTAVGANADGSGTGTLHVATTGTLSGNCTGSAIAANPGGTSVTSIQISTTASSGTASATNGVIEHTYQTSGCSSGCTVDVVLGNPVPVYTVTFTSSDISTMNKGEVYVRAQAYPNIGNVILDTQVGAAYNDQTGKTTNSGQGCDWFFINVNSGVCNSSSAAWFAANGQNVSPNIHNLWAYNDSDNSYSPVYCFIGPSGTATTEAAACSTSTTAPASTCTTTCAASEFVLLASLKTYNGTRTTPHGSDINGFVFCHLPGTYSGFGGNILTSITNTTPGVTVTSVASAGTCPNPVTSQPSPTDGHLGSAGTSVTWSNNTTVANTEITNAHLNNFLITGAANFFFSCTDSTNSTSFPTCFDIFESHKLLPTASNVSMIYKIGTWYLYGDFVDEATYDANILHPNSVTGAVGLTLGETVVCGSFTAVSSANSWILYNALGDDAWGCQGLTNNPLSYSSTTVQATSSVIAYDKFFGSFGPESLNFGSKSTPLNNLLFKTSAVEVINNSGGQTAVNIQADDTNQNGNNMIRNYTTIADARINLGYHEGTGGGGTPTVVTTGGSLSNTGYYIMYTESCITGLGPSCNSSTETSTDGPAGVFTPSTCSGNACTFQTLLPCNPNYLYNVYMDTSTTVTHYATVTGGNTLLTACQTINITAVGSAHTPPASNVALSISSTFPAQGLYKSNYFNRFNIDNQWNAKSDYYGPASGNNGPNGARVGDWELRFHVGDIGDATVIQTSVPGSLGTIWNSETIQGDYQCWLCYANTNAAGNTSAVVYASDRGYGSQNGATQTYPALNIGQGDYCVTTSTNIASLVPSGYATYPWDITGQARNNAGSGWAGAYESGCQ